MPSTAVIASKSSRMILFCHRPDPTPPISATPKSARRRSAEQLPARLLEDLEGPGIMVATKQ